MTPEGSETPERAEPAGRIELGPHILVVDDDERILSLLKRYLTDQGFTVATATDAGHARLQLSLFLFDLLVIDVMMPGEDGVSLTKSVRERSGTPVLMLTAMTQADDRIRGLEAGADDYLAKPFEPRELVLRIRAILRRLGEARRAEPAPPQTNRIVLGACSFDLERDALACDGQPVHLTTAELALLRVMAERPGQVVTREELAALTGAEGGPRAIDVQVTRLRKKIEGDSRTPRYLRTARGKGYQLMPD